MGGDRARIAELEEKLRSSEGSVGQRTSLLQLLGHDTASPACDLCCTGMVAQGGGWKRLHKRGSGRLVSGVLESDTQGGLSVEDVGAQGPQGECGDRREGPDHRHLLLTGDTYSLVLLPQVRGLRSLRRILRAIS